MFNLNLAFKSNFQNCDHPSMILIMKMVWNDINDFYHGINEYSHNCNEMP
jgi:hypothetical protein